jgi:hypothetical protein
MVALFIAGFTVWQVLYGKGIDSQKFMLALLILGLFALFVAVYWLNGAVKRFLFLSALRRRRKHRHRLE